MVVLVVTLIAGGRRVRPQLTDDDAAVCTDRQATRYLDEGQGQLDPQSTVRQGIRVVWSSVRKQNA